MQGCIDKLQGTKVQGIAGMEAKEAMAGEKRGWVFGHPVPAFLEAVSGDPGCIVSSPPPTKLCPSILPQGRLLSAKSWI